MVICGMVYYCLPTFTCSSSLPEAQTTANWRRQLGSLGNLHGHLGNYEKQKDALTDAERWVTKQAVNGFQVGRAKWI